MSNAISKYVESTFRHISEAKLLNFSIETDENLPGFIETDSQRLNQILKNLLSNSFKFTEKGSVNLKIHQADKNWKSKNPNLDSAETVIAFEISDTGIGISREKQNIIFEAFQQAEGSTSRKYGGTGLGLSISRGLSDLLGGTIELESNTNEGSKFTLFWPLNFVPAENMLVELDENQPALKNGLKSLPLSKLRRSELELFFVNEIGDDRSEIKPDDKTLLIVEDDPTFAKIMLDKAHKYGLKAVVTDKGNDVIDFIGQFHPNAITMDINMPDTSGWKVLDRLKTDFNLRHIPVYVISGVDDKNNGLKRGARSFLLKPIKEKGLKNLFADIDDFSNKKVKSLLVVDDNEHELEMIVKAIEGSDTMICTAKTAKEAMALIKEKTFDCIILDLVLPDGDGLDIIKELESESSNPKTALIVYSAKDISKKERTRLNKFANRIILKSTNSLDQLIDQTALFLHRVHKELPEVMRSRIESLYTNEDTLNSKKVLLVDDVRNLFALTTALERCGMNVLSAESGKEAIHILEKTKDIDVVLMDIMMPEMDGYETMKNIRSDESKKDLTIIAVTAKAMKGDRQKCIASGASDYITKPVNVSQLLSLLRVWIKWEA